MTTLADDLNLALSWAQTTYPQIEAEVVDNSVYLNYEWSTAVVIDVEYREEGKVWSASACHWDETHGIDADAFVAEGDLATTLQGVQNFLEQKVPAAEKLDHWFANFDGSAKS